MFSFKNKLDPYLYYALQDKLYKNFRVIITCKTLIEKIEKKILSMKCQVIRTIPSINSISAILSPRAIERLLEYPEVKYIGIDKYAFICAVPDKRKKINYKSMLNKITLENKTNITGKNITIGIVDTGVFPHIDLISNKNKIKKFLDLINGYHYPYDDNGHGTFISGIICSSGISSKGQYKGISPGSYLYSIKAFNKFGKGFISDILFAINILITEAVENNIKIICLPFETLYYDKFVLSLFQCLFNKAIDNGIVVIVPSGNNTNEFNSIMGISILPNCITVGGLINSSTPYNYSSLGNYTKTKKPDVSALCNNICSLNTDTKYIPERNGVKLYPHHMTEHYTYYSGTSCAAAYVSGICALLYEYNPNLNYKDILSLLKLSCRQLEMQKSLQGAGIVDINKIFK